MILRILVRDSVLPESCAIGVVDLVSLTFLCVSIVVHVITMMLVGILEGWVVVLDYNLLRRRIVISDMWCDRHCSNTTRKFKKRYNSSMGACWDENAS